MRSLALLLVLFAASVTWLTGNTPPVADGRHVVRLNGHNFTLPVGFTIEQVAGPPLVDRPINADFDDQGRLYVSDSSGSNDAVKVQLEKKPHRLLRLEDTQGTGHFDKRTIFADKLMFPEGVLCREGSVYVAAPPSIWKFTDADGDGVAEKREEWFQGKTLTGCANDLHGPYTGPDGWIYWCKGAFAQQTYERPGKPPLVTKAAHIFRSRPDGTGIEPVMTGGMDNPVEVVFTPSGERIFTTTFLQHPGGGNRDGLIHAIPGGIYGKIHGVLDSHPWTAPTVMPVLVHLGPAAPSGLVRYASGAFGPEYKDNLFASLFNLRKITRHVLKESGSTYVSQNEDFLVSDNFDFHPTDVLEDADGSLLVLDTGGWYKLCCPSSQLHKPDILGAIYRIKRTGMTRYDDPRGSQIPWAKSKPQGLVALLYDRRPVVRRRAMDELVRRGPEMLAELHDVGSVEGRRNAVWVATRFDSPAARAAVRAALKDEEPTVRQVALHSISLWRDPMAAPALLDLLAQGTPHNRRLAAECLGRLGDRAAVPALLKAAAHAEDRPLQHAITFALIEIANKDATAAGLASVNPLIRRTALVALDQMPGGNLSADVVARELASKEPVLRETATWIAGRHAEWGDALAATLGQRLAQSAGESDETGNLLLRFVNAPAVQRMLADALEKPSAKPQQMLVLSVMARSGLKLVPAPWLTVLQKLIVSSDAELQRAALDVALAVPVDDKSRPAWVEKLTAVGQSGGPDATRLTALSAVRPGLNKVEPDLFLFLRARLDRETPVALRSQAVDVLSRADLTTAQLSELAAAIGQVGPLEIDRLLPAFEKSTEEAVGLRLIASLQASPAKANLRPDMLKTRLIKYGGKVPAAANELYAQLDQDAASQKSKLEALVSGLAGGDIRRGQAVFNSAKAACSSCHAVGYVGGKVGPDLSRVGNIRTERDLLESIAFPSASFVRGYEPTLITTRAGKTFSGVVRSESATEVVLALDATQEERIARGDIEEIVPGKISIMPAGLDQQLTPAELADLVAFLKNCK